jgi:hypothetical protein
MRAFGKADAIALWRVNKATISTSDLLLLRYRGSSKP